MTIIDKAALDMMTGGSDELLSEMATMFVQLLPDSTARMRLAIEAENHGDVSMVAHQLRSRAGYFGAHHVRELAVKVESRVKQGCNDAIAQSCCDLMAGIDELLVELRSLTGLRLEHGDDE